MTRINYLLILLFCLMAGTVSGQDLLKGTVYEYGTDKKLQDVLIRDNNTRRWALSDNNGNFQIKTETGHLLIFNAPGYVPDTLYVVDLTIKKIRLEAKTIALREVTINSTRPEFDPQTEYPEIYKESKIYVMSPTSWFSKKGRDARALKRYFKHEAEERHIDAVFSRAYVGSIAPLKGRELEDFMTMYRPTYAFVMSNNSESLAVYINSCYKKFEALPPDKRKLPRLTDTTHVRLQP